MTAGAIKGLPRRIRYEWLGVTLAMLGLTVALSLWNHRYGLSRFEHVLYDYSLALAATEAPNDDIVIITIDDDSIREMGYWPWRRGVHASLLERLGQARAVGLDLVFMDANPAYPDDDERLARALAAHGRTVLPLIVDHERAVAQPPLAPLASAARALGYINIYPDSDGVIRSLLPSQALANGQRVEHFSLALLQAAGKREALDRMREAGSRPLLIPYSGPPGHYTHYPYMRVLDGQVPAEAFRDKFVLVGAWGSGLGDVFNTPLSKDGETMSGVEILANGLNAALGQRWIHTPAYGLAALLACLPVLAVCLSLRRFSPRHSLLVAVGALLMGVIANWLLLRYAHWWVPLTPSLVGAALAYPVWTWRSQEAALQYIDQELMQLRASQRGPEPGDAGRAAGAATAGSLVASAQGQDRSLPARVDLLNAAIEQFRLAQQRREETLRFLSHDMRAPQNAILALTQLQARPATALAQDELLTRIDGYANKTLALVDGFVQLARTEAMAAAQVPVELVEQLGLACDEAWVQARRRHITLHFDTQLAEAWTKGDPALLARVWTNLIDNAIKYSPDHTQVRCRLAPDQDERYWRLEIADQGRGMTPGQLAQLFTPFTRHDEHTPGNPAGVGLGLAFVHAVVLKHEATIEASSEAGRGTCFTLRLPRMAPPPDE